MARRELTIFENGLSREHLSASQKQQKVLLCKKVGGYMTPDGPRLRGPWCWVIFCVVVDTSVLLEVIWIRGSQEGLFCNMLIIVKKYFLTYHRMDELMWLVNHQRWSVELLKRARLCANPLTVVPGPVRGWKFPTIYCSTLILPPRNQEPRDSFIRGWEPIRCVVIV